MKHVTNRLNAYLAGELTPSEAAELEAHLEGCSRCAEVARRERRLWDLLGEVADESPAGDTIWPEVRARTVAVGSANEGRTVSHPALGWSLASAAVAAGLALGLLAPAGLLDDPKGLTDPLQSDQASSIWLSDGSWLSAADDDGLDLVWLSAGPTDTGEGS